jgi:hypothetical protein
MLSIAAVRSELESKGWSRQSGTLEELRRAASLDGLISASNGTSSNERVLVPYDTAKAPRLSLSAVYGLGKQPLHSDGAHLREQPDVIVLHSAMPTPTSTVVWTPHYRGADALPAAASVGIFTVRGNGESFLATARNQAGLRFDPVVMSPGDWYARETVEYLDAARARATTHLWDEPDLLLFIDNRRSLHARDEVLDPDTRSITRVVYKWGEIP